MRTPEDVYVLVSTTFTNSVDNKVLYSRSGSEPRNESTGRTRKAVSK